MFLLFFFPFKAEWPACTWIQSSIWFKVLREFSQTQSPITHNNKLEISHSFWAQLHSLLCEYFLNSISSCKYQFISIHTFLTDVRGLLSEPDVKWLSKITENEYLLLRLKYKHVGISLLGIKRNIKTSVRVYYLIFSFTVKFSLKIYFPKCTPFKNAEKRGGKKYTAPSPPPLLFVWIVKQPD